MRKTTLEKLFAPGGRLYHRFSGRFVAYRWGWDLRLFGGWLVCCYFDRRLYWSVDATPPCPDEVSAESGDVIPGSRGFYIWRGTPIRVRG